MYSTAFEFECVLGTWVPVSVRLQWALWSDSRSQPCLELYIGKAGMTPVLVHRSITLFLYCPWRSITIGDNDRDVNFTALSCLNERQITEGCIEDPYYVSLDGSFVGVGSIYLAWWSVPSAYGDARVNIDRVFAGWRLHDQRNWCDGRRGPRERGWIMGRKSEGKLGRATVPQGRGEQRREISAIK